MRVVLVSGGDFFHAQRYLTAMAARRWELHWAWISPGPPALAGVTVHPCYGWRKLGKAGYFVAAAGLRKLVRRLRPDLVMGCYATSGGLAAWLGGFRPYVVTVHGSDLIERSRTRSGRFVLRRVFGHAALVSAVAEHMRDSLLQLGAAAERVLALPVGVDLAQFPYRPAGPPATGGLRLVCTRSLNGTLYDIPTVLRAVARARAAGLNVTLSLPATGRLEGEFRSLCGELGIAPHITFGGGYRNADVPGLLAGQDAYVSASLWDGASISLLEAMACGVFPIVSDIPANREWIAPGKNGLLFPVGDWQGLADLILSLPPQQALVQRVVRGNRVLVEARADRERNLQVLLDRVEALVRQDRLAGTAR